MLKLRSACRDISSRPGAFAEAMSLSCSKPPGCIPAGAVIVSERVSRDLQILWLFSTGIKGGLSVETENAKEFLEIYFYCLRFAYSGISPCLFDRSDYMRYIIFLIAFLILGGFTQSIYQDSSRVIADQKKEINLIKTALNYYGNLYAPVPGYKYILPISKDDFLRPTSPFGIRNNPLRQNMGGEDIKQHNGVDLIGTWHGRVVTVASGKVIEKWYVPDGKKRTGHPVFGGYIRIQHDDGYVSGYGHLSAIYVHEGERVEAGQVIGRIGSTGKSTGEHLHFSIQDSDGNFLQPLKYINIEEE